MTRTLLVLLSFLLTINLVCAKGACPKKGRWIFEFVIKNKNTVPIEVYINNNQKLEIKNSTEQISLNYLTKMGDTMIYEFPDFYSQLYIVWTTKKTATGYFWNKNKQNKQLIAFEAKKSDEDKFYKYKTSNPTSQIAPRYKSAFSSDTETPDPAIGLFTQQGKHIIGTFLTETGDYRYLSGNVYGNKIYLSCFDGSHLFLFTAEQINGRLFGEFYSGATYQTKWEAEPSETYELTSAYSLTFTKDMKPITFRFPKLAGGTYTFPEDSNNAPLTIVQIMGTWCPNCMDETRYYLELSKEYADRGLKVVVIGFEYGADSTFHRERLQLFKTRYNIPFTILIGGENSKKLTSEKFPQLNGIMSYPTSLFFDKNGTLIKTHTGFSGPGTGQVYQQYKTEMENFLERILKP